jgi:hypothetical protein
MGGMKYNYTILKPRYKRGVSGQPHVLSVLFLGEQPPVPIVHDPGWAPEPVWTLRRRERSGVPIMSPDS